MGEISKVPKKLIVVILLAVATSCFIYYFSNFYSATSAAGFQALQTQNETALKNFETRRARVKQECRTRPQVYYTNNVMMNKEQFLVDNEHHAVFCYIQKNGCSFWKRVFSIVDGKHQGQMVFNLSGTAIHREQTYADLRVMDKSFLRLYHFLHTSKKIVFVRDPYERLFSGYVDKIFDPCGFKTVKETIIKYFRSSHEEGCSAGITFSEFLRYVTNKRFIAVNEHFQRQYTVCAPCHIDYDFIGKLESFRADADFVLEEAMHMKPSMVFGPDSDFDESNAINILTDVIHRIFRDCKNSCFSKYSIMLRLWITFQVRGFISVNITLPVSREQADNTSREQFKDAVFLAYRLSNFKGTAVKQQRQLAVQEAYRSVDPSLLERVYRYVYDDCRLFGYDCLPHTRFHLSSPPPPLLFHMDEALRTTVVQ